MANEKWKMRNGKSSRLLVRLKEYRGGELRDRFLLDSRLALKLFLGALQKRPNHFPNPFLHFRTDSTFTNQRCKAMQFSCVGPAEFHVLGDFDQDVMAAHFKSRGISQIVFHLRAGGRPLKSLR